MSFLRGGRQWADGADGPDDGVGAVGLMGQMGLMMGVGADGADGPDGPGGADDGVGAVGHSLMAACFLNEKAFPLAEVERLYLVSLRYAYTHTFSLPPANRSRIIREIRSELMLIIMSMLSNRLQR